MKKNNIIMMILLLSLFVISFLILAYGNYTEDATNNTSPNLLIRRGVKLSLLDNKLPQIHGQNPLLFESIYEYEKYQESKKKEENAYPIIYMREYITAAGQDVLMIMDDPLHESFSGKQTLLTTNI